MKRVALLLALLSCLLVGATASADPSPGTSCTKYASYGDNLNTKFGTLVAGDVLCLHAGDYPGAWSLTKASVTITNYPGESVKLTAPYSGTCRNNITFRETADYSVLRGVRVTNGNTGGACENFAGVFLNGADNAIIEQNEIDTITEHGVFAGYGANDDTIRRNYVHDIGTAHGTDNADHAIYADSVSNLKVVRNLVQRTVNGHAIQIYNGPTNTLVSGNVVTDTVCTLPCNNTADHATAGIIVANSNTTGTHVVNNIVYGNSRGIFGYQTGSTNEAHGNVAYNNPTCQVCNAPGSTMTIGTNIIADPQFVGYPSNLHVASGSPAVGAADAAFMAWPDYDGATGAIGSPDIGAFEQ